MYTYEIRGKFGPLADDERLYQTRSLAEATKVRAAADSRILCGGTDFYTPLGTALPKGTIVDLTRVAELDGIEIEPNQIRIGACTSWTKLVATPLPQAFDGLKAAAREVGSIQIQNRATIGGNLCNASPAADGVPPLLALDAEVELVSAHATRRLRSERLHPRQSSDGAQVRRDPFRRHRAASARLRHGSLHFR